MNRRKKFIAGTLAAIITFSTLMVVAGPQRNRHRNTHHHNCEKQYDGHSQGECAQPDSSTVIQ